MTPPEFLAECNAMLPGWPWVGRIGCASASASGTEGRYIEATYDGHAYHVDLAADGPVRGVPATRDIRTSATGSTLRAAYANAAQNMARVTVPSWPNAAEG